MRAAEEVSLKGVGHSFARKQSLSVEPPFDRLEHEESLSADVRRNRYIFENRDPLPGGFVFGGRVVISGGQAFFAHPRPTINRARAMLPSKPIRHVVLTHHHDDHAGGRVESHPST